MKVLKSLYGSHSGSTELVHHLLRYPKGAVCPVGFVLAGGGKCLSIRRALKTYSDAMMGEKKSTAASAAIRQLITTASVAIVLDLAVADACFVTTVVVVVVIAAVVVVIIIAAVVVVIYVVAVIVVVVIVVVAAIVAVVVVILYVVAVLVYVVIVVVDVVVVAIVVVVSGLLFPALLSCLLLLFVGLYCYFPFNNFAQIAMRLGVIWPSPTTRRRRTTCATWAATCASGSASPTWRVREGQSVGGLSPPPDALLQFQIHLSLTGSATCRTAIPFSMASTPSGLTETGERDTASRT